MGFQNGHIKSGGRKKGVRNNTSRELKLLLSEFLLEQIENLPIAFSSITSPERRLDLIIKLIPYVLPKAQEISLDMLSDAKLDSVIEKYKNEACGEN